MATNEHGIKKNSQWRAKAVKIPCNDVKRNVYHQPGLGGRGGFLAPLALPSLAFLQHAAPLRVLERQREQCATSLRPTFEVGLCHM